MKRMFLLFCCALLGVTSILLLHYFIAKERLAIVAGIALLAGMIVTVLITPMDDYKKKSEGTYKKIVLLFVANTSLYMFYFLGIAYFLLDLLPSTRNSCTYVLTPILRVIENYFFKY